MRQNLPSKADRQQAELHHLSRVSRPPILGDICHIMGGANRSMASTTRGHCQRRAVERRLEAGGPVPARRPSVLRDHSRGRRP